MGVGRGTANLLSMEQKRRPFSGCVLQLGRQDVGFRPFGYSGELKDEPYFRWLGFETVHSCDVSYYEKPSFILDLNVRPLGWSDEEINDPEDVGAVGPYDVVLDGGTLEHVFHLPNALQNVHDLLKVGGRAIHVNGVSNWVEHGFYSFSPCFWWDYYAANRYEINECFMVLSGTDENAQRYAFRYRPGCLDDVQRGMVGGERCYEDFHVWECFFVATKTAESTSGVVPQQRRLSALWQGKPPQGGGLEYLGVV